MRIYTIPNNCASNCSPFSSSLEILENHEGFISSCSDEDEGVVEKEQLIGTWLIISEIKDYTKVEIVFKESNQFELKTYTEKITDSGAIINEKSTIGGSYTLKDDKVSFDNRYYLLIKSLEGDTLKGEIDFGDGVYSVIAKKQ